MKLMKSFPGGTLLVPMFISAVIATFFPNLFRIGGLTEAMFTGTSLNFILASAVFLSGTLLNINILSKIFKRYAPLMATRLISNIIFGILFARIFGLSGILGISSIAFIAAITSLNPTIFLAIMNDYGDDIDKASFGFVSLIASPVIPMFIYGLTSPTDLDLSPIISTLIPLGFGILIGNLDRELSKFLSSGMDYIIFFLGWSIGTSINLLDAFAAGFSGLVMAILYYILSFGPIFLIEKLLLKRKGLSAIAMSSFAGLSASIPMVMVANNPEIGPYVGSSAAIISLCVVISAIVTPFLAKKLHDKKDFV